MDMYETDDAVVILLDLAGVDASQTEVHAEPHLLIVRGMRRERHPGGSLGAQRNYHTLEIPYGRFERTIHLPAGLDAGSAQANYREGLLEITLPKRVARQVPITVRDGENAR
jgi:HSP20 family protein